MDRQLVELAILLYNFGLTSQTVALSRLDLRRAVGRGGLEVRPEAWAAASRGCSAVHRRL